MPHFAVVCRFRRTQETMMRLSIASLCLFSLVACGGDDGGDPMLVDAGADAPPAANCKAAASYTATIDDQNGGAETGDGMMTPTIGAVGALNMDPDILFLDLWDGYGVFENGLVTGTFTIAGDETAYETCGACVTLAADAVINSNGQLTEAEDYMATGGTLTITSISGTLSWSLSNVTMQHVTFGETTTPVGDGCTTTLSDVTFSGTVDAGQLRSKNGPIRVRAQRVVKR